jgi:hypothetical protein
VRYASGLGLLALTLWALSPHLSELEGLPGVIDRLNWWWVPPAVVVELASFACFAAMEFELLKSGGLRAPRAPLVKTTFGAQALTNSLPGGNAVSSVYGFRWFRRFGADSTLATWALIGTFVASMVSLSLVAALGLAMAAGEGASLDLVPVLIGVLLIALAVGALFVYEAPLHWLVEAAIRALRKVTGRPRGDVAASIEGIMHWVTAVRLGPRQIGRVVLWGSLNWLLDCACFAMMFQAVGAPIPWKGLLLAYGAGQLAATLPFTPGGLGAVEGSITVALVAFGGVQATTVDAVLIYRIISFWFILVLGWGLIGELALQVRRGRWNRQATSSDVDAGPAVVAVAEAASVVSGASRARL